MFGGPSHVDLFERKPELERANGKEVELEVRFGTKGKGKLLASTRTWKRCSETDQPIAGLLTDLKRRGLLSDTLVIWGGEFGRMPTSQGGPGRDHNPRGFSVWMAGGGIKGGTAHGATDEIGYAAADGKTHVHDLHATILHLLGVDHTRLTYFFGGRNLRLTDTGGEIIRKVLA